MISPEQIVRALAATYPNSFDGPHFDSGICLLCHNEPADHEPDCPWRLAVEWTAEQDGRAVAEEPIVVVVTEGDDAGRAVEGKTISAAIVLDGRRGARFTFTDGTSTTIIATMPSTPLLDDLTRGQ